MEAFARQISVTTKWTMSVAVRWPTWTHGASLLRTTYAGAPRVEMEGRAS